MTTAVFVSLPSPAAVAAVAVRCVPRVVSGKLATVTWCQGMRLALQDVPENSDAKGLSVMRGWEAGDLAPRFLGVVYKAKAKAQGLVLNHCPWCGERIRV